MLKKKQQITLISRNDLCNSCGSLLNIQQQKTQKTQKNPLNPSNPMLDIKTTEKGEAVL